LDGRPRGHVQPPRTRAKISNYHNAGKGMREIAQFMGISMETVSRWVRKYEAEGNVETRPRPGRPRVTTAEEDERLIQEAGRTPQKTAVILTRETELRCYPTTTRRHTRKH
ncbi:putative actin cytoskeleton-regulatory complex protein PAN1-like 4, partial [Homarus americanus]